MELKEINYMDLLEHYTQQFKDNISIKEVIYQMAKDNLIDKREMRNRAIIKDYDNLIKDNDNTINDIMATLSFKYNLSTRMIQEIIYKK